jgi:hypothetical protein
MLSITKALATACSWLDFASSEAAVVFVGAEYCPYCASERWPLVMALSKFGTFFEGLRGSMSSTTDLDRLHRSASIGPPTPAGT